MEYTEHNDDSEEKDEPRPAGLANVMAAILGKKKIPKKAVILAKGKTDKEIATKRRQKEKAEDSTEAKKLKSKDDDEVIDNDRQKLHEQRLKVCSSPIT